MRGVSVQVPADCQDGNGQDKERYSLDSTQKGMAGIQQCCFLHGFILR
jgi:hypothetical protein